MKVNIRFELYSHEVTDRTPFRGQDIVTTKWLPLETAQLPMKDDHFSRGELLKAAIEQGLDLHHQLGPDVMTILATRDNYRVDNRQFLADGETMRLGVTLRLW